MAKKKRDRKETLVDVDLYGLMDAKIFGLANQGGFDIHFTFPRDPEGLGLALDMLRAVCAYFGVSHFESEVRDLLKDPERLARLRGIKIAQEMGVEVEKKTI